MSGPEIIRDPTSAFTYAEASTMAQTMDNNINSIKDGMARLAKPTQLLEQLTQRFETIAAPEPTIQLQINKFSGYSKGPSFKDFQTQVNLYFLNNPHLFTRPNSKMFFILSNLEGAALIWVEPFIPDIGTDDCPKFLENHENLLKELKMLYGVVESKRSHEYELRNLRQRGDFTNYLSSFRILRTHCRWGDEALHFQFYSGLDFELQREVDRRPETKDLDDLINTARKAWDFILQQRANNRLRNTQEAPRYRPPRTNNNNFVFGQQRPNYHPDPSQDMDLSTVQTQQFQSQPQQARNQTQQFRGQPRAPLTPQEKERRRQENLCLYCGSEGHFAYDCPNKRGNRNYNNNNPSNFRRFNNANVNNIEVLDSSNNHTLASEQPTQLHLK